MNDHSEYNPPGVPLLAPLLDGVDGWLSLGDAAFLAAGAARAAARTPDPLIVEVGAWKGRSAIALAQPLTACGRGRLVSIDPHLGEPTAPSDTLPEFLENVRRAGVSGVIEAVRSDSLGAVGRFAPGSIHFFFLDGSHEYEDVVRDIAAWTPMLAPGATIAFDDADWPGVNLALRESVARVDAPFRKPRYLGKILYVTYEPDAPVTVGHRLATARFQTFLRSLLVGRVISERTHWRLRPAGKLLVRSLLNSPVAAVRATRAALALTAAFVTYATLGGAGRIAFDAMF